MDTSTSGEMGNIQVVEATFEHIPMLIEIEKSVLGNRIYSPMLTEEEWKEEMQKSEVFLICKDGYVVGNLSYELRAGGVVYISGIVICPEFQGQGIARMVLARLLGEFSFAKRIELVTHPENIPALKLYESLGFVVESRKENYYGDGEPRLMLVRE